MIEYTESVGRLAAKAGKTLVSGGARGIDQAAMRGALEAGGRVIGVMADSLEKAAMNRDHREMLMEGQLVLISPYDPGAGFNVGNAMQRNKLIYALSDAALVVNSDLGKGGTWAGAVEQLDKLRMVPVYVRSSGAENKAFAALQQKGALPWPNPTDSEGLVAALSAENEAGCAAADSKMPIYIRRMLGVPWGPGKSSRPSRRAVQNAECSSCQRPGAGAAAIKWVIRTCQPIVCMARRSDVCGRRDEPGPSGSNSSARVLK